MLSRDLRTRPPSHRQSQDIFEHKLQVIGVFQAIHNSGVSNLLYVIEHTKALSNTFRLMTLWLPKCYYRLEPRSCQLIAIPDFESWK
jgi:hypothetical protein